MDFMNSCDVKSVIKYGLLDSLTNVNHRDIIYRLQAPKEFVTFVSLLPHHKTILA